jgi:predicted transcriptional regulator
MDVELENGRLLRRTGSIVGAYVGHNTLSSRELPALIGMVQDTLCRLAGHAPAPEEPPVPAVPIKNSVTPDYIFCLEDGLPFKSLKRHLSEKFGLSPDGYRRKWGLPPDYPMTAPNYSAVRSLLAKQTGFEAKAPEAPKKAARRRRLA